MENSFAGNICRCTGYRPIADAFKSFAADASETLKDKVCDLEDLAFFKPCGVKCSKNCQHKKCDSKAILGKFNFDHRNKVPDESNTDKDKWCLLVKAENKMIVVDAGNHKWYKAFSLSDIYEAMGDSSNYKLIAGNTGQGTYFSN